MKFSHQKAHAYLPYNHKAASFFRSPFLPLRIGLLLLAGVTARAQADDYFDPSLLAFGMSDSNQPVDLSRFETAGGEAPGKYLVDIWINGELWNTRLVTFTENPRKNGPLISDLTPADLEAMGVNVAGIKGLQGLPLTKPLGDIEQRIPHATARLDMRTLRLNVSVPQADMRPGAADLVDPSKWQEGIPAFLLDYTLSGSTSTREENDNVPGSRNESAFASIMGGLNLGAWRVRSNATWIHSRSQHGYYDTAQDAMRQTTTQQDKWTFLNRYVERDIAALHSELTIGDTALGQTAGQIFDGFSYRGINLASDTSMRPARLNGFAPVIQGTAQSNAQVTIKQNGTVIYQAYVPPGPFRITDLSSIGSGGDLQVLVKEADGSVHGFTQAYASLPIMQRPGGFEYELAAGRYRQGYATSDAKEPAFATATMIYGLPFSSTLFGGVLSAEGYQSVALGTGTSLGPLGAVSLDGTWSHARLPDQQDYVSGASYRLRYAKSVEPTGTTINLMAYRYSTRRFYNFTDANSAGYALNSGVVPWLQERRRSTFQVSLDQRITDSLTLYLSGTRENYWNTSRINTTLSGGLSGSVKGIGWGLSYSVDRIRGDGSWPENRQIGFSVSFPLNLFTSAASLQNVQASWSITHDNSGRTANNTTLNGALGSNASWNAGQSWGNQGQTANSSLGMGYNGSAGSVNLGYNQGGGYRNVNGSVHGGLLVHQYGVTLAPSLSGSSVLVRAPGASGVSLISGQGVSTNHWGYAVSNSLSPYRRNTISLDPTTLPDGADLKNTSVTVWPTRGAVVLADFKVRTGQQVLMTLTHKGRPVPFGATAGLESEKEDDAAIVGDGGQVYLSGMPEKGSLLVKWGDSKAQCKVHFDLGPPVSVNKQKDGEFQYIPLKQINEECQ